MITNKGIQRLTEKTQAIEDAALRNREAAARALGEKFPTPLSDLPDTETLRTLGAESETAPDWKAFQGFIAGELEMARLRLEKAALAYKRELQDDPRSLKRRDEVVRASYQQVLKIRHVLENSVGETEAFDLLGISGTTPRRPQELLGHMRAAVIQLRDPARVPEELDIPGMTLSWADLADAMERDAARLAEALDRYRQEERDAALALFEKDEVQASVNDTYVGFTKVLEGLYIAAGMRRMAERLRLTIPASSSGRDEDPEVEEPVVGSPDTPQPPANDDEGLPLVVAAVGGSGVGVVAGDVEDAGARPVVAPAPRAVSATDDS